MWGRKVGQGPKTTRIRIQYPWSVAFRPIVSPSSLWWLFISIWKKISARMISPKLGPLLHYVDADADRDSLFRVLLSLPVWLIWTPVVDFRPQPLPSLEYVLFCSEDNATHLFIIRILIHCQRVGCLLLHCTLHSAPSPTSSTRLVVFSVVLLRPRILLRINLNHRLHHPPPSSPSLQSSLHPSIQLHIERRYIETG